MADAARHTIRVGGRAHRSQALPTILAIVVFALGPSTANCLRSSEVEGLTGGLRPTRMDELQRDLQESWSEADRSRAARILGHIINRDNQIRNHRAVSESVSILRRALREDKAAEVREAAFDALFNQGLLQRWQLVDMLSNEPPTFADVRRLSAEALATDPMAVSALSQAAVADSAADVRRAALFALDAQGVLGSAELQEIIGRAQYSDTKVWCLEKARGMLDASNADTNLALILFIGRLLRDQDPAAEVRRAAFDALFDRGLLPRWQLVNMLSNEPPVLADVRILAAEVLRADPMAISALSHVAAVETVADVRRAALLALEAQGVLGSAELQQIIERTKFADTKVWCLERARAMLKTGKMDSNLTLALAIGRLLRDQDSMVRAKASVMLTEVGDLKAMLEAGVLATMFKLRRATAGLGKDNLVQELRSHIEVWEAAENFDTLGFGSSGKNKAQGESILMRAREALRIAEIQSKSDDHDTHQSHMTLPLQEGGDAPARMVSWSDTSSSSSDLSP